MPNPNPFKGHESGAEKSAEKIQAQPVDAKVLSTNDDMKNWSDVVKSGSASKSGQLCLPDFKIEKDSKEDSKSKDGKNKDPKEKDSKDQDAKDKDNDNDNKKDKDKVNDKDKDGKRLIEIGKNGASVGAGVVLEKLDTEPKVGRDGGAKRGQSGSSDPKVDLSVQLDKRIIGVPTLRY